MVSPAWCRVCSQQLLRRWQGNALRCIWRTGWDDCNCCAAINGRSVAPCLGHGAFPLIRRRRGELGASRLGRRDSESVCRCSPQNLLGDVCRDGNVRSIPGNNYVCDTRITINLGLNGLVCCRCSGLIRRWYVDLRLVGRDDTSPILHSPWSSWMQGMAKDLANKSQDMLNQIENLYKERGAADAVRPAYWAP